MFDELNPYKKNGHFFFSPGDYLADVCNAPADKVGVYLVYALKMGRIELVYIGATTEEIGLKDQILKGEQFGNKLTDMGWTTVLTAERIEALDVYWYVTKGDGKNNDDPEAVQDELFNTYGNVHGVLPDWNNGE